MLYYLIDRTVYDDNLRPLMNLSGAVLGDVRDKFIPLSRYDARRFLDTLWEETYSLSRGSIPKGEVGTHKRWAEATYAWHLRLVLQTTLCPTGCLKKPPHIHVTYERLKLLSKIHPAYERALRARNH